MCVCIFIKRCFLKAGCDFPLGARKVSHTHTELVLCVSMTLPPFFKNVHLVPRNLVREQISRRAGWLMEGTRLCPSCNSVEIVQYDNQMC